MEDDESFLDTKRVSTSVYHSTDDFDEVELQERRPRRVIREQSLFFQDGHRSVDFVLAWDIRMPTAVTDTAEHRRFFFEEQLGQELELETEEAEEGSALTFVKIHVPLDVLKKYAEILKLRVPMKEIPAFQDVHDKTHSLMDSVQTAVDRLLGYIYVDSKHFPQKSHRFTAVYSRSKEYLFDTNASDFFSAAIRSRIVDFILDRTYYEDKSLDPNALGINRLITEGVYSAAYPLHDGDLKTPGSQRYLLYHEWASVKRCLRYQPLDYVKDYFGVKIGLYFAWLGFYTHMLLPASVVGLICFAYSWVTLPLNKPTQDICNPGNESVWMCPLCDHWCDYWDLRETCFHAKVTYLFDNPSTVFFAIFMSFWGATFLELWKRYSAEITHRWDLTSFDINEEHPRPQYLMRVVRLSKTKTRKNSITMEEEPHVPFWSLRFPATVFSFSVVLLLILLALAAVLGVVLYRVSVLAAWHSLKAQVETSSVILITSVTAACINLCCIVIFNWFYMWLAEKLTEMELLRTQTEFDDSLTLKIYLLQFVNYYASIFYIAFFKGKFVGRPGDYNRVLDYRQEECGPGGCLMELCIQLSIIMVGKQAVNTLLEMLYPLYYKWVNTIKVKTGISDSQKELKKPLQWCKDYKLVEWGPSSLFDEYLEMVLQYGFVTIFVAAFPLAPFFALLNNILEMRLDAQKLLKFYRRPVTQRVRDIGVWYRILDSIGKLSVITNAFIIAFTTEFIPRLVYKYAVSSNQSLEGYLDFSLASFNVTDFEDGSRPQMRGTEHVEVCRYPDFRMAHTHENKYSKTDLYWHIMAARFAFVVVFENVVALVMILVRWCIPDVPRTLRAQIRREAYLTNEMIIAKEAERARGDKPSPSRSSRSTNSLPDGLRSRQTLNGPVAV
ncbi:anoctamin-1 isoform X2 [Neocloeon triangulifer]|uniref:anoctamin-1 isoform X2 n=1 Tax=Neocloeon triangulifer TaxID=2078957 RepID=UPI00286F285D|nr:anoctamin-1 isoform X2 [Neocloeon triangulifer]